jgi:hypothetical protein
VRRLAPDVVTGLADHLDGALRSEIRNLDTPKITTADLRRDVADLIESSLGETNGERLLASWDFNASARCNSHHLHRRFPRLDRQSIWPAKSEDAVVFPKVSTPA